jgi:hypothetical protein
MKNKQEFLRQFCKHLHKTKKTENLKKRNHGIDKAHYCIYTKKQQNE